VLSEPLTDRGPVQASLATQLVAFVALQVSVDEPPVVTTAGLALSVTAGGGSGAATVTVTDWVALPPAPSQVSV
jgi:hypothetical protein